MPCHQSCGHAADTLANVFAAHCDKLGMDLMYRPLNRLDRDTSGAVLVAKNRFAAATVTNNFHKTYQAILDGIPPQMEEEWMHRFGENFQRKCGVSSQMTDSAPSPIIGYWRKVEI